MLEATACREGMALAIDLNLRRVKMASDCANVIRRIHKEDVLGPYGQLVREMKATEQGFDSFVYAHEERRSNGDAHNLARGLVNVMLFAVLNLNIL
ncbi:hypothetical protein ACQ4PT_023772 [Festuca glaucescens]